MCGEYFVYMILDAEHEDNFEIMKKFGEPQWLVSICVCIWVSMCVFVCVRVCVPVFFLFVCETEWDKAHDSSETIHPFCTHGVGKMWVRGFR